MIVGMLGTNIEKQVEKASGGYEIVAFCNMNSPIDNIEDELDETGLNQKMEKIAAPLSGIVTLNITTFGSEANKIFGYYRVLAACDG